MRACKHFEEPFGEETDIVQSDGGSWNAWKEVWSGDSKIYSSFEAGLMLEYLQHLAEHPECVREIGWKYQDVIERLREIEAEWKEAIGYSDP
jgi:hypothetical protein